jgi:hypothetical protein
MGYNFYFMRAVAPIESFPATLEESMFGGELPWTDFKHWLISQGGSASEFEASTNPFLAEVHPLGPDTPETAKTERVHVDYGTDGTIDFGFAEIQPEMIFLDNHALWEKVLEAYVALHGIEPLSCLCDPQTGLCHDQDSFGPEAKSQKQYQSNKSE